jgi:hypothetical protein
MQKSHYPKLTIPSDQPWNFLKYIQSTIKHIPMVFWVYLENFWQLS